MGLGIMAGRTFVNDPSFAAYAEVVPAPLPGRRARHHLAGAARTATGHQGARPTAPAAGTRIEGPQALLISNDPFEMGASRLGGRRRLDAGPSVWSPSGWTAPGRR